eukprot:766762-Hanusia_phi.AAC.6
MPLARVCAWWVRPMVGAFVLLHLGCATAAGSANDKLQTSVHAKSAPSSAAELAREISDHAQKLQNEISSVHASLGRANEKLNSVKDASLQSKLATKTVKGNELADAEVGSVNVVDVVLTSVPGEGAEDESGCACSCYDQTECHSSPCPVALCWTSQHRRPTHLPEETHAARQRIVR